MNHNDKKDDIYYVEEEEVQEILQCLPKVALRGCKPDQIIVNYQNTWYIESIYFRSVLASQKHFIARDNDILISSFPKTGTTWLKSLLFSIVNRANYPIDQSPLLTKHPQELVCTLETVVYNRNSSLSPRPHQLDELPSPRIFSTHVPYTSLPESIKTSGCRIIYICRNPLDTLVSYYYFFQGFLKTNYGKKEDVVTFRLEDAFEDFCEGTVPFGPPIEHILGFWKTSLEQSKKVLFLQYEDLKEDPNHHLKRLANFIGMPFTPQEESEGVIQQIVDLCSIKNLKELEVNKSGVTNKYVEKNSFFRKGEVGDWTNHLTPTMFERLNKIMQEKLEGTDLSFKFLPN